MIRDILSCVRIRSYIVLANGGNFSSRNVVPVLIDQRPVKFALSPTHPSPHPHPHPIACTVRSPFVCRIWVLPLRLFLRRLIALSRIARQLGSTHPTTTWTRCSSDGLHRRLTLPGGRGPLVRVRAGTGLQAINQMRPDAVPLGSCRPVWGPRSSDRESRVPYRPVTSVWMERFNYSSQGKSRTFVRMSEKSQWTNDVWKMDFKGLR